MLTGVELGFRGLGFRDLIMESCADQGFGFWWGCDLRFGLRVLCV